MNVESILFETIDIGKHRLKNRIVMAPMSRSRASVNGVATNIMAEYYSQRASAGLIISEASQISLEGTSYPNTPGIYNQQQINAWKKVTEAVHEEGGKIFIQLLHGGRISHPDTLYGMTPIAPSAIKPQGTIHTIPFEGKKPFVRPRALALEEIGEIVTQFGEATQNAMAAGFDGVEIHAANGYLLDQFLRDGTNKRTDNYGGGYQNRCRLLLEVIREISKYCYPEHIGVRLSPLSTFNDMEDSNPLELYKYLMNELNNFDLAYVHFIEDAALQKNLDFINGVSATLGRYYNGKIMGNGNYYFEKADFEIFNSIVDFVSFGKLFISNPDLPKRFMLQSEFNLPDESTYYMGDSKGYIDYEFLDRLI